jgi:hypothetical protein
VSRRPQNGPTFSKAPPKKQKPMTDRERADRQARNEAALDETKRIAAKSRRLHQLLHRDPSGFVKELMKED